MSDPSFWENGDHAKEISQKATEAKAAYDTYTRLFARAESIKELLDMAIEENDQDMEGELEEEINELKDILDKKEIELLLNDEYDANDAIITFHAGAGGTEAQDWTEMLIRMYIKWAESEGFVLEELNMLPGDEAGVKSAEYMVRGKFAYGLLKSEKGVHRLVRISPFDAAKRRHTSFSAVDVMPEIGDDIEIDLNMADVRVDYYRASGAGGQHINKTSSAIRITHLPTGMVVECQDERSQYKNKDKALKVLKSRLLKEKQDKQASEIAENRKMQVGTGDRSERIRTYNYPQGRVTDHRIGLTLYKLEEILNGSLDEVIDALVAADRAEKLKESMEK